MKQAAAEQEEEEDGKDILFCSFFFTSFSFLFPHIV